MKQTALILVFSLSILVVQAQKLGEILKEIKNGERVDTPPVNTGKTLFCIAY